MLRRAVHRIRFGHDHGWVPAHASDYLDGDLGPREIVRVQRHVAECAECRELVRGLQTLLYGLGTLRGEPSERVAGTVLASVRSRLRGLPPTER
jgi:hypothetical protein